MAMAFAPLALKIPLKIQDVGVWFKILSRFLGGLKKTKFSNKLEINHFLLDMPYVEMVYLQLENLQRKTDNDFFFVLIIN